MTGGGQAIAVVGAGSWGTALAVHLARIGHDVRLWARDRGIVERIGKDRENPSYLPGIRVPDRVTVTPDMDDALTDARFVVFAVPSHGLRAVAREAAGAIPRDAVLVSATKGIEPDSLQRMSEVLAYETGDARPFDSAQGRPFDSAQGRPFDNAQGRPIVVLSGPTFAAEVARELPTVAVAASNAPAAVVRVQEQFRGAAFRLYGSDDVAGVEIGGAMKNIIAIAAGVVEGLGLGHNSMAALITRGLAEISRLAAAEGGRKETLAGLSGLGDLVLTCTGDLSRNRHVGVRLGQGHSLGDILSGMRMVAEGVRTTGAALALGERHALELPITAQMAAVLDGRTPPREAVEALMGRRQKHEVDG